MRNYKKANVWYPLFKDGIVNGRIVRVYAFYIYNPALNRKKRIMYLPTAREECMKRNAKITAEYAEL